MLAWLSRNWADVVLCVIVELFAHEPACDSFKHHDTFMPGVTRETCILLQSHPPLVDEMGGKKPNIATPH